MFKFSCFYPCNYLPHPSREVEGREEGTCVGLCCQLGNNTKGALGVGSGQGKSILAAYNASQQKLPKNISYQG